MSTLFTLNLNSGLGGNLMQLKSNLSKSFKDWIQNEVMATF